MTSDSSERREPIGPAEDLPPAAETPPAGARKTATATLALVFVVIALWITGLAAGLDPYDPRWALTRSIERWTDLWRLFGHSLLHAGFLHLISNAVALWLVGPPMERMIGARGLLTLFGFGVLAAAIAFFLTKSQGSAVGASGGIFAVQGAALVALARNWRTLAPGTRARLFGAFAIFLALLLLSPLANGTYFLDLVVVYFELELTPDVPTLETHLMHGASLLAGAGAALWLLDPRPWRGAVARRRATAIASGVAITGAVIAAIAVDQPRPITEAELAACEAGDRDRCASMAERFPLLCEAGDAQSCHNLGVFTERGYAGTADATAAAAHYRKGCDLGNAGACYNLGQLLAQGAVSGEQGAGRAVWDRACRAGLVEGCNALGSLLLVGADGPRDLEGATRMFEDACRADFALACRNLGILISQRDDKSAKKRAAEIFANACKLGDPESCEMSAALNRKLFVAPAKEGSGKALSSPGLHRTE